MWGDTQCVRNDALCGSARLAQDVGERLRPLARITCKTGQGQAALFQRRLDVCRMPVCTQ